MNPANDNCDGDEDCWERLDAVVDRVLLDLNEAYCGALR